MIDQASFLIALRKIDRAGLTARDILLIESVRQNPGCMGRELATRIGLQARSNLQFSLPRLKLLGMIEDRRPQVGRAHVNILHITPAGERFLDDLIPQHDL